MQKYLLFVLLAGLFWTGCKPDDPTPPGTTGGTTGTVPPPTYANGFKVVSGSPLAANTYVTLNTLNEDSAVAYPTSNNTEGFMGGIYNNNTWDIQFSFRANGTTAKTYTITPSSTSNMGISFYNNNTMDFREYSADNGTLVITKYGAVGETIEGTFTGTFYTSSTSGDNDTMKVDTGRFRITRKADQ